MRSNRVRKRVVLSIIVFLLLWVGGFAYFFRDTFFHPARVSETISTVDKKTDENAKREKQKVLAAKPDPAMKKQSAVQDSTEENEKEVVAGWVIITDPWGRQVTKFRAGLAGNGWLALPARACLGGTGWHFYPDSGGKVEIIGGVWMEGDDVGLWHLAKNFNDFDGPELAPWNDGEPVSWFSLESMKEYHSITLSDRRDKGYFLSFLLPDYIDEIGIFVQRDKIVGWSFGQWLTAGYLWNGKAGTELEYETWVSNFYTSTFANGREEKFAMALAMKRGYAGLDQLAFFIEGFRLQPKLAEEDTPYYLLPEAIVKRMRILITNAVRLGEESRVVDLLSSQMLKRIGDISLLMDMIPAIASARGFEAATGEIEDSGAHIVERLGRDVPALNELHVQLYQDWLQSLVSDGAVNEGWRIYDSATAYYPDDPYIHLLGVELELLDGDWEAAERLLYMRNYPPTFQDRYELLAHRISEAKGQEGKIVIRFPQGSHKIPVTAAINETLSQDFLVDTGASLVTIPSSTARALGLKPVQGNPGGRRNLSTAGGVVTVSEVIIDAIEIDGWVEYDVRAFVLDIPGQPGLGLLGLNYLGRFNMDLKTDEGILMLAPR